MSRGPFTPDPVPTEDLAIAVRELSVGASARRAFIVDNLVEPCALLPLHMAYRRLPYTFGDMDRSDTEFARHLVHYFEEADYESDPAVATLLAQARAFMDDRGLDYKSVQRIYANFNLFGDFQFAHPDGDDSWTALFFINSSWNDDWAGEFLLYEDGPQAIAFAIQPKPGRMVLFDGEIIHRGGSPSKYCLDARITVAIKFDRA